MSKLLALLEEYLNRFDTRETLGDRFRRLWEHHHAIGAEDVDCSKSLVGRGWPTMTRVEEFQTSDGVMCGKRFFVAAESAKDGSNGIPRCLEYPVYPSAPTRSLLTTTVCAFSRTTGKLQERRLV